MNPWNQLIDPAALLAPAGKPTRTHRERRNRNPWGLTTGQLQVLSALVELKSSRLAAGQLGLSIRTVEEQLYRARQRMGAVSTLDAALMWDRHIRAQQVSTPG